MKDLGVTFQTLVLLTVHVWDVHARKMRCLTFADYRLQTADYNWFFSRLQSKIVLPKQPQNSFPQADCSGG